MVPVLIAIALALASMPLWWRSWQTYPRGRRVLASVSALCAAITALLGAAHLVVVAAALPDKTYDFRVYSLLLLGVSLVLPALVGGAVVPALVRGDGRARHLALGAFATLLLVNLPLIPLQGFAIFLSIAAAIGISAVVLLRTPAHL
jgi:hypothetical protein